VPTDATGEVTVVATVGDETAEAALRVVAEQRMPSEEPQPTETVETPPPAATEEPTADAPSPTRTPRPKHRRTPTPTVEPTEDRQEEDSVPSTVLPSGDEDAGFEAAAAATTLSPRADARVAQSNPNTNYGRSTQVRVDGGGDPEVMSYLRFDVPSVGSVSSAKLRLWVTDGTADGPGVRLAGNQWTESGITWNKRPAPTGALVADLGRISSGRWAEFDVTSLVQAPGAYTFAIVATSTDGANFASREDSSTSRRPRLVITTGGSANPTPVPTKTPTPAPTKTPTPAPTATPSPAPGGSCPTTLQALVDAAAPGATVRVPACVYRETVTVTKSVVLDGGGQAEVRGSDVWTGWTRSGAHWVKGSVPAFSTGGICRPGTSRCAWPEQVFLDGRPLLQVAADPGPGQFAVDGARRVLLADDPTGRTVEVTVRPYWVVGRAAGVTVRGFTMKHAASPAQHGGIDNNGFANWTVADNALSDAHGANVSLHGATGLQLLNNDIARAGQLGVHGNESSGAVVRGNRIHDNNTEAFEPGWEAGGLKMAITADLTLDGNEVYANDGPGLWCDGYCTGTTISNNRVHHNTKYGINLEVSHTGRIFGNVVWENGWGSTPWVFGAGILLQNSDSTEIYANTVAWNGDGIGIVSQNRVDAPFPTAGIYVHDNVIVSTGPGPLALGWVEDWAGPLFDPAANNRGANNTYWFPDAEGAYDRFEWRGPIRLLGEFLRTPGDEGARYLTAQEKDAALGAVGIPTASQNRE
jgi:parallel beta-helix repeat protein